jgi:acyl-CoA synthetase (AMP-forming)/AMP-acid ligase II
MVKSRGYRIELGDIESALYGCDGVKEAAVVAVPDDLIGNRLAAFVVPLEGKTLTVSDLQSFCGERLPRYMIPELIKFRDVLPKTSTGKIDRTLLVQESKS